MSYIAIDLGNKRVGIAVSRENIAFAKSIIPRTETMKYLKEILRENSEIHTLIIGLPYDLFGKDTRQLEKTKSFIKKLQDIFPDKNIIGHDERFSSISASQDFSDHRDDIAAQLILQSYLDSKK